MYHKKKSRIILDPCSLFSNIEVCRSCSQIDIIYQIIILSNEFGIKCSPLQIKNS